MIQAWLRAHRRAAADALRRFVAGGIGSALTVLALGVVIALPAGGHWLLGNFARVGEALGTAHEVSIYLAQGSGRDDIRRIEERIVASAVARWRFVDKDEALASLRLIDGLADVTAGLAENPLPDSFVVEPRAADAAALAAWAETARGWPQVDAVQVDSAWAQRLDALLALGRRAVWLLGGLLAVALVAVTFSTIRLQIAGRQAEIEVALLVGATPAWVARPFLWLGALEGLAGGVLACAVLWGAHLAAAPAVASLAALYGDGFALAPPGLRLAAAVIGASGAIGWLGALLSVRDLRWRFA